MVMTRPNTIMSDSTEFLDRPLLPPYSAVEYHHRLRCRLKSLLILQIAVTGCRALCYRSPICRGSSTQKTARM